MAEPVSTRQQIRRAIGRLARMDFYMRYADGFVTANSTEQTTTQIAVPDLTQRDDFWNNSFVWQITSSEDRRINDFDVSSTAGFLGLEYPLAAASSSLDTLEITSLWSPTQIHAAINASLESVSMRYPDVVVDNSLVVEENRMQYALSGLTTTPWSIMQIYVERPASSITGNPTGATATTLSDTAQDFSTNDTDHFVSIYGGTGSGQLRETSTGSSDGVLTVAAWTTNPDTTSLYRYWDAGNQQIDWYRVSDVRTDAVEYPDNVYFSELYSGSYGGRIKIIYLANQTSLAADSDETTVPILYITHKALSMLHDSLIGDNRVDRGVHASLAEYYDGLADKYLASSPRRRPSGTMWRGEAGGRQYDRNDNIGNPMGWDR